MVYTQPRPYIRFILPTTNHTDSARELRKELSGRALALDLGTKRVGVAVSDELRLTVRTLPAILRTNWKQLLQEVARLCEQFDVRTVVIGLPLRLDGSEGDAAAEARRVARNLSLSLDAAVCLQDERLTSREAEENLRASGVKHQEVKSLVDSEAAKIILSDFLANN